MRIVAHFEPLSLGFFRIRAAVKPRGRIVCFRAVADRKPEQFLGNAERNLMAASVAQGQIDGDKTQSGKAAEQEFAFD